MNNLIESYIKELICVQTLAGIFCEIKNKSDDKWRNMGK